jgi:hypothetical protein
MPRQTEIGVRLVETPGLHDPQNQALWEALPTAENQKTTDRQAGFLMPIAQNDVTPGTTTLRPIFLPTLKADSTASVGPMYARSSSPTP